MSSKDYHRVLLVAFGALVVGFIYVAPHVAFILELGDDYHYPFLGMTDERHYGGRIREAYEGNYSIGNPFLLEYKKAPYIFPPLPDVVLALLYRTFGLSVEVGMVVSDFVFPFLIIPMSGTVRTYCSKLRILINIIFKTFIPSIWNIYINIAP